MARKKPFWNGYTVFMTVMVILLILAIALFVYGSTTNGLAVPHLPGKGLFAWGIIRPHG